MTAVHRVRCKGDCGRWWYSPPGPDIAHCPACAPSWTVAEDAILRTVYPRDGIDGAKLALPARTESALFHRARRLGLQRRRRWTPSDDTHLRDLWSQGLRLSAIAKHLGRTKATTYWRAQKIGLPLGCPEDFEYLSAAAKRTGYCTSQLWRILGWAGVTVHAAVARPVKSRSGRRMHVVDPLDVDDAIASWLKTETANSAAKRLGISGDRLRARLRQVGVVTGKHQHARVTEEQVARANALAVWSRRNRLAGALREEGER